MARTDENGKQLPAVLGYLLDRSVTATEIYGALGIARNTYSNRCEEDDYPNAEELRLVATHFDLNALDLMVRFGLIQRADIDGYLGVSPLATATRRGVMTMATGRVTGRLARFKMNPDAPPV